MAPLNPNKIPEKLWQVVSMDLMEPLLESKGFNMIFAVVDRFTKKSFFLLMNSTITSKGLATLYRDRVFVEHGIPKKIISDRGSQFVSKFMTELFEILRIRGNLSTAYHPQTDGQMERVNQEIKEFLTMFVNEKQDDWNDWLAVAQFCHNNREHSAMGYSPFFLNYGHHPRKGLEPKKEYKIKAVKDFTERMTEARDLACSSLKQSNELMKKQYDNHQKPSIEYKRGDKVYINAKHLPHTRPSKKLDKKFFGPYEIIEKVGTSTYQIKIPANW